MKSRETKAATTYTCPMHPEVKQDRPGTCPKCKMALVPQPSDRRGAKHEHDGRAQQPHGDETADHGEMIRQMRAPWLWTNFTVIALGFWLMTSPFTFGYQNMDVDEVGQGVLRITAERDLPSVVFRGAALAWSDLVSGLLLIVLAAIALWPRPSTDFCGRWGVCFVGIWLQLAPLVFWFPSPAAYANDTLIGTFAIAFSILVPMMPGMAHHMAMMKPGPEVPPGWSYNPSSWHQRAPMIALALVGWFISRYLAAVQLGYISAAWEPFFGEGTANVLHSDVSRMWPISDAGLGAVAYTIEMLMGWMGAKSRWRTMPWMVLFFFILVVPLGLVHIVLVILQPVAVGSWCTFCLAAAFVMLCMIPLAVDEVIAMGQFMVASVKQGKPFWRTFWVGDTIEGGDQDTRTPRYGSTVGSIAPAMVWGVTAPWNLLLTAALGLWLMFSPALFGVEETAADSSHLVGALIVTVSVIVMAEVIRAGRFLNLLLGAWTIAAPWLLSGATAAATWNSVLVGAGVIVLSIPRGPVRERYGSWNRYIV